jgi:dTDP-4-amino-4,6-dideoxygalactose transaminase
MSWAPAGGPCGAREHPRIRWGTASEMRNAAEECDRLAIDGGEPVRTIPPPRWPTYSQDEIAAVVETLSSGYVNQWTGHRVRAFERAFAQMHEMPHAVALANGSLALEAILRAHGIGPADEVIVTPRSFIASASCVNVVGAKPVFADIEIDTEMVTPATARPLIGPRTKAIIVVHLNGRPADMVGFLELGRQYGIFIFEDCAQAHGARIDGRLVGSFGDASAFSFCQDKIMTTGGEGGMALFRDDAAWKRAWAYKDHGKRYDAVFNTDRAHGFRWLHESFGSNWRLTELQAAIGLVQLSKLLGWRAARTAIARQLAETLGKYRSVHITALPRGHEHAYYRFEFRLNPEWLKPGWTRDRVMTALWCEGIPSLVGACPEIYLEAAYAQYLPEFQRLPNAAYLGQVSLALPVAPTYDHDFLNDCRAAINKVFCAATF